MLCDLFRQGSQRLPKALDCNPSDCSGMEIYEYMNSINAVVEVRGKLPRPWNQKAVRLYLKVGGAKSLGGRLRFKVIRNPIEPRYGCVSEQAWNDVRHPIEVVVL